MDEMVGIWEKGGWFLSALPSKTWTIYFAVYIYMYIYIYGPPSALLANCSLGFVFFPNGSASLCLLKQLMNVSKFRTTKLTGIVDGICFVH